MAKRKWWQWIVDPMGVWEGWGNFLSGEKSFADSFYGDGTVMGGIANGIGALSNAVSGQTQSDLFRDQLADENATVAHEREQELMALQAQYNSVGYKAEQLGKAGLNPVLASGVSNTVGGASAHMSQPNAGQGQMANFLGLAMDYGKLKQEIKESDSRILANKAAANASQAAADEATSRKQIIDKEVVNFDAKFNLDKGLKEAQTSQLRQAEKNMRNWLTNGSISSIAQLIGSLGIVVGSLKGFASSSSSEVLIPEVVDGGAQGSPLPDMNEIPKRLSSGNVKGTKSYRYDANNNKGVYTMDDGSEFEYGVDENGLPWSKTRPNPYNGNVADAENLMNEWMERLKPLFGE